MNNKNHTYPQFDIRTPESIIGGLSNIQALNTSSYNNNTSNILILANGFEDRANAFINRVCNLEYKVDIVLVAKYDTNVNDNESMYDEMERAIYKITDNRDYIDADNQQRTNQKVQKILNNIQDNDIKVVFDISSASDRLILSVLHALTQYSEKKIVLDIVYYEAESYQPIYEDWIADKDKCAEMVLTSDIQEMDGVEPPFFSPLYNGCFDGSYSDLLISIPTLKLNRPFAALFESDENFFTNQTLDSIYWILGKPEEHIWREELQQYVLKLGLEKRNSKHLFSNNNKTSCSTLDYKDIMQKLFYLIDENIKNRKNITIMPMGSKMQTIGVALTLYVRSECKVLLVKPKAFNRTSYTSGVGQSWTLQLNLNDVKNELKKIGCYSNKPQGRQNTDKLPSS